MSKSRITNAQLKQELADHTPVPAIAEKYGLTPKGVRNHITRLHKKEREEPAYRSYGQQQGEKLKEQARVNPNNCLQTLLESEKIKTKQLLQEMKKLEEENTILRTEELRWIQTKVALPPETPEGTPDEDCPEYIVTIAGAANSNVLKYSPDGTWFDDNGFVYKVIAWQPLPEPYREG